MRTGTIPTPEFLNLRDENVFFSWGGVNKSVGALANQILELIDAYLVLTIKKEYYLENRLYSLESNIYNNALAVTESIYNKTTQ